MQGSPRPVCVLTARADTLYARTAGVTRPAHPPTHSSYATPPRPPHLCERFQRGLREGSEFPECPDQASHLGATAGIMRQRAADHPTAASETDKRTEKVTTYESFHQRLKVRPHTRCACWCAIEGGKLELDILTLRDCLGTSSTGGSATCVHAAGRSANTDGRIPSPRHEHTCESCCTL